MPNPLWLGNTKFPHGWNTDLAVPEAMALAAQARKRRAQLLGKLKAAGKGSEKAQRQAAYLGSSLVRLDALISAAKRLPYSQRLEITEYQAMAQELKLYKPIDEPVRIRLKEKSGGGYRYFCSFAVRHRAAQALVAEMIKAQFTALPVQYGVAGRGVREAIARARKYHESGFKYAIRLDIQKFFDSFNHEAIIAALPIPKDVTEHVAIGRHYNLDATNIYGGTPQAHIFAEYTDLIGQCGLPQGSACSSAITSFFMSKVLPPMPKGTRLLNYVDDFLILAQSPERAEKAKNALTSSIEEMQLGSFKLLEKSSSFLHEEAEFLGHRFDSNPDGELLVTASPANINKAVHRLSEEWERISGLAEDLSSKPLAKGWLPRVLLDEMVRYATFVKCWLHTFQNADNIDDLHDEFMAYVLNLASLIGVNAEKVLGMVKQQKLYDVDFYSE